MEEKEAVNILEFLRQIPKEEFIAAFKAVPELENERWKRKRERRKQIEQELVIAWNLIDKNKFRSKQ